MNSERLLDQLESAADWKDSKPFRDAELFRQAANRIRSLESELQQSNGRWAANVRRRMDETVGDYDKTVRESVERK